MLHGEVNGASSNLPADFEFSLAAFLIAASASSFFGYSDGRWELGAGRGSGCRAELAPVYARCQG